MSDEIPVTKSLPMPDAPEEAAGILADEGDLAQVSPFALTPTIPRLIFLNGPSQSGKTTIANMLIDLDAGIEVYHHAQPLWAMLECIQSGGDFSGDPTDEPDYESQEFKDSLVPFYPGLKQSMNPPTQREVLIQLGRWVRAAFGNEKLGAMAATWTGSALDFCDSVVYPAVRTPDDLGPLVRAAGKDACILLRIYRTGCEFTGDVGDYINPHDVDSAAYGLRTVDIHNDGTEDELKAAVLKALGVS